LEAYARPGFLKPCWAQNPYPYTIPTESFSFVDVYVGLAVQVVLEDLDLIFAVMELMLYSFWPIFTFKSHFVQGILFLILVTLSAKYKFLVLSQFQ